MKFNSKGRSSMKNLNTLTLDEAKPETQKIFEALKKKIGMRGIMFVRKKRILLGQKN